MTTLFSDFRGALKLAVKIEDPELARSIIDKTRKFIKEGFNKEDCDYTTTLQKLITLDAIVTNMFTGKDAGAKN